MNKNRYINESHLTPNYTNPAHHAEEMIIYTAKKLYEDNEADGIYPRQVIKAIKIINGFLKMHSFIQIDLNFLSTTSTYQDFNHTLQEKLDELVLYEDQDYSLLFKEYEYNLTDEEHESIQTLLNKLRNKIVNEDKLDIEHKERILKKLNEMQIELNKNMSSFDTFLGKAMDVWKVLKYGREEVVSPLLKDTTELVKAVNKIESEHSDLVDLENQIEHKDSEEILDTEIIEKNQIEHK